MTDTEDYVTHNHPVWRDRSDFIIHVPLPEDDKPWRFEQLFARRISEDEFEVCCIPYFAYDMALGDIVRTSARGSRKYVVEEVVTRSGRFVFRVWFGSQEADRQFVAEQLTEMGALLEWRTINLLAVDAANEQLAQVVANWLQNQENLGNLVYETGKR
jgi:hypothetical protein